MDREEIYSISDSENDENADDTEGRVHVKMLLLQAGHFLQRVALSRLLSPGSGQQVPAALPAPPLHTIIRHFLNM